MENNSQITIQDIISKKREKTRWVDTKLILRAYEYAVKKVESQMNLEEKKKKADFIINSTNSFDSVEENVIELIKKLKEV